MKKLNLKSDEVFLKNQKGQGLTEYITLLVLVSLVCVGAAKSLGGNLKAKIKEARDKIKDQITLSGE